MSIPIPEGLIKQGGNRIQLTTLEGSWLVFDQVRLEGPENVKMIKPENAFLRNVTAADYELKIDNKEVQPLLLDVQHLSGNPLLQVELDGKVIFKETVEHGRSIYEAPMTVVKTSKTSSYTVLLDGKPIEKGTVERLPKKQNLLVDYVDTKIGTGHSRWMIAPGPWMPFGMVKISPDNQKVDGKQDINLHLKV